MIRQLIVAVAVALSVVVPLWVTWRVILFRRRAASGERIQIAREALLLTMVVYASAVAALTLVPHPVAGLGPAQPSFVPFRRTLECIGEVLRSHPRDLLTYCTGDFVANIALLFPFGLLAPFVFRRLDSARRIVTAATIISVSIELIQFLEKTIGGTRTPDIDDVILNVVGAGAGYLVFRGLQMLGMADASDGAD